MHTGLVLQNSSTTPTSLLTPPPHHLLLDVLQPANVRQRHVDGRRVEHVGRQQLLCMGALRARACVYVCRGVLWHLWLQEGRRQEVGCSAAAMCKGMG
jgi:hypothetical protein